MIDINRNFVNNTDLNEDNSTTHLIEYFDPIDEGEINKKYITKIAITMTNSWRRTSKLMEN